MRSALWLCVLGLLCLYSSVSGQDAVQVQPGVLMFCDDPSVEKAVHSAMHKFNEGLSNGKILALFQTLSARKSENGADSVYSLEFTSRRSDCPAGGSKPWTDCDYQPYGRKEPIFCNATVYMTETEADTREVNCMMDMLVIPERAPCLGCPEDIDLNSEDLKVPITASIAKYNTISDSTHLFSLHSVGTATRQVVAGLRYRLTFDMRRTTCAKAEHQDLHELCVHDDENLELAYCNSTVDVAPWRLEPPGAEIECEAGAMPPVVLTRRRPPGWSPLRKVEKPSSAPSMVSPSMVSPSMVSPSKASDPKQESSEEDTKTLKPAASPSTTTNPFHCPSKPWKLFNPIEPETSAGPTNAPAVEGGWKDTDLLA